VAAGQYIAGFLSDTMHHLGYNNFHIPEDLFSALLAAGVSIYFWWQNIRGIHESSGRALQIMKITTLMVIMLIIWCVITLVKRGAHLPPFPSAAAIPHDRESLGWMLHSWVAGVPFVLLMVGFGHSVLAMSGEESLAQVNREIEHPKLRNLKKAALVIGGYSLFFTALVSFFAVMIIPDAVRPQYYANLISGLAMHVVGPYGLKLVFQGFVVLVGALILSGALNTSIIGANGVLNRLAEDGILTPWFKKPHSKFGTSYRVINMIAILQLFTIIASRGNIYLLASLYAFGVVWSFALMSLAVLVLRYKVPENREWKVPGNIRIRGVEIPIGVALVSLVLFATAFVNFFTKELATIAGVSFSVLFFILLTVSEKMNAARHARGESELEQFRVAAREELTADAMDVRPGSILVAVRDPKNLFYLKKVLAETDTTQRDVVVMTARVYHREHSFSGSERVDSADLFEQYERELFTAVVNQAEKQGKHVSLLVTPTNDVFEGIVATAQRLGSTRVVCGLSNKLTPEEQGKLTGDAWERLPDPKPRMRLEVFAPNGRKWEYILGPHTPRMRPQDLKLMHDIWLHVTRDRDFSQLHHYHVVSVALRELNERLHGPGREQALEDLKDEVDRDDYT
jgi:amino acid transporter